MSYKREAGDRWRVQVDGARPKGEHMYGERTLMGSEKTTSGGTHIDEWHPHTVIDEIVIGRRAWFHLEGMDTNSYWMNIGGLTVNILLDKDGNPKQVRYEVESPVEGCEYDW